MHLASHYSFLQFLLQKCSRGATREIVLWTSDTDGLSYFGRILAIEYLLLVTYIINQWGIWGFDQTEFFFAEVSFHLELPPSWRDTNRFLRKNNIFSLFRSLRRWRSYDANSAVYRTPKLSLHITSSKSSENKAISSDVCRWYCFTNSVFETKLIRIFGA